MTRHATLAALFTLVALGAVNSASAQVLYYDHHSTAAGDWLGGSAEVLHGQAAYVKAEAEAAEIWVRATAAHDDLLYQRFQYNIQAKQQRLEYQQQRREDKLARKTAAIVAQENQAMRLQRTVQMGGVNWPAALMRPEFSSSMSMIESVLRNWNPNDPNGDAFRRALASEAGVLRNKISNNRSIPFASRVEAVQTLKQLQLLAGSSTESFGNGQLASLN